MNRLPKLLVILAALSVTTASAFADPEVQVVRREPEPAAVEATPLDSIYYAIRLMDQNKVGMTLSNYSFIGTNFNTASPSFEYPLGSSHMHMVRGGLWVGAVAFDTTEFVGVSTGAVDGSKGNSGASNTEFTPATNAVHRRSTLRSSDYFVPGSVSELDFVSRFSDFPAKTREQTGGAFDHRPLGVTVTQYNYAWSFSDYANIVFFHYVVKNNSDLDLTNAYFGLYNELASGSMADVNYNPGSAWFRKKEIGYVDSLNLFTERYCEYIPVPTNCHYFRAPELVGVQLLGLRRDSLIVRDSMGVTIRRDTLVDIRPSQVSMQAWSYSPRSPARDEDSEKYVLMSAGTKTSLSPLPDSLKPYSGDPVELLAIGPVPRLSPGDSVYVDFAYMGAVDIPGLTAQASLISRGRIARRAYELNYIVPVPPPSPSMRVVSRGNAIDVYWKDEPESFVDPTGRDTTERHDFEGYRVNVGESRNDLRRVAQFDLGVTPYLNDTTGFNTGMGAIKLAPPVELEGETYQYKYTIDHLRDGFRYWVAVTSYDRGTPLIESLESGFSQNEVMFVPGPAPDEDKVHGVTVFPNPYRVETKWDAGQQARSHYLWFANLPKKCALKIYTLSGALIYETEFDGDRYDGSNARGLYQPGTDLPPNLSGTMFGWDMITREGQATATGLYIWAVEDKQTGKHQTGKFLLVKSDREDF